jgi:glycosyltransferase involved in cell wall biosynthesis
MKPKILFILHLPPPVHGAAMVGKYIQDSELINNEFHCQFINLALAKDLNDIGKGGITKLINFIKKNNSIRRTVKEFKPDLCYVTPNAKGAAFYKDFVVVMMLKAMGQKVVVHYHNKGVATRQNRILDNWLYQHFFKKLIVILLAKPLYQDICKYVKVKDVYFCPNGIPIQKNIPVHINHEKFNILFLSNMMEEKGVWNLVEACRILKEKGKRFHCHFVGKWSDIAEEEFRQKIQLLNLSNCISAYGGKYGNEKETYFQKADVFVFPTYYNNECFPLVLLEAMEHGLPCISTQEGGIAAIIDEGKTGYVIEKKNPQVLADKIKILMEQPVLCKTMGIAGREKLESEFTLEKFECKLRDIFQEIFNSRN